MMAEDDFFEGSDQTIDASAFISWIDDTARSEGKTREELLETLVTSYWTLDEMFRLMEEADPDSELSLSLNSPEFGTRESKADLRELKESLTAKIDDLNDRFRYLNDEFTDLPAEDVDELVDRLEGLEERVEAFEQAVADGSAQPAGRTGDVESIIEELANLEEEITGRHETLEGRISDEFGHLRIILKHLLTETDTLGGRADQLEDRIDEELSGRRQERETLDEIRLRAARLGVSKAVCEYCDASVQIGLLPLPECPQCERPFSDIRPKQGWFGSPTLLVSGQGAAEP